MREFDLTNNNCLWILKTYEAHKKELLKKTKEVENPMIIRDDIVKWNWIGKGKSELRKILLNCYTLKSVLTKDKTHTDTHILDRWAIF